MPKPFVPDLSSRPFSMAVERLMQAAAEPIYDAWTRSFDKWFAQPGELIMTAKEGRAGTGERRNATLGKPSPSSSFHSRRG